jgi:hypothetical protein
MANENLTADDGQTGAIHSQCVGDLAGLHCDRCGSQFVVGDNLVEIPEELVIYHESCAEVRR